MKMINLIIVPWLALTGCTISMQNISTHGNATDLVDENLRADADITAEVPLNAI